MARKSKSKRERRRSSHARMYPMRNRHHILPRSRNGGNERENIILLRVERHESWHYLFGDKTIEEVIELLLRVHRLKGRCTSAFGACLMELRHDYRRQDSNVHPFVLPEPRDRVSRVH